MSGMTATAGTERLGVGAWKCETAAKKGERWV